MSVKTGMRRMRRILVSAGLQASFGRKVMLGIVEYGHSKGNWEVVSDQGLAAVMQAQLAAGVDGILAQAARPSTVKRLLETGLPVVNFSTGLAPEEVPFPTVANDDRMSGRLAAEHLIARNFRQLLFIGIGGHYYSQMRAYGARDAAEAAGMELQVLPEMEHVGINISEAGHREQLREVLGAVRKPVGVMLANDHVSKWVLAVCRELGLSVPDEVALVGHDDDELECNLGWPPLSSVRPDAERIGYLGAMRLDRILRGEAVKILPPRLVLPKGVTERRSSSIYAVEDRAVGKAMEFIRTHFAEHIGVEQVARAAELNRRVLEIRYRKERRCSPGQEIQQLRLGRAKELLATTTWPVSVVALRAGYPSARQLTEAVRRQLSTSPLQYRRSVQSTA